MTTVALSLPSRCVPAVEEEPVESRIGLPTRVGYQVSGHGPIRGHGDPLWRHQKKEGIE